MFLYPIYASTHLVFLHMPFSTQVHCPNTFFCVVLDHPGLIPEIPDKIRVSRIPSGKAGPNPTQSDFIRRFRTESGEFRNCLYKHPIRWREPLFLILLLPLRLQTLAAASEPVVALPIKEGVLGASTCPHGRYHVNLARSFVFLMDCS